jgi:hypothetical protein
MRHPLSNDKVIIKRGMDGHFVYFSVRDDRDNGSIIDFVQNRQRLSLGAVRKELRPWINQPPVAVPSFLALPRTEKGSDEGRRRLGAYAGRGGRSSLS